jgi:hypothetical protein
VRELITEDDIFATVLLLRTADPRAVLLVEGPRDLDVVGEHLDKACFNCIPGHGKSNVVSVINHVDARNVDGVLALVDKDFDFEIGMEISSPNLIYVDYADLDTTVFLADGVACRVLHPFSDRRTREAHLTSCGASDEVSVIVRAALPVSMLRFISIREDLQLRLRGFPIHEVVDLETGTTDIERLLSLAAARSGLTLNDLLYWREEIMGLSEAVSINRWKASGHDLHATAAYLVRAAWGGPAGIGADVLSRAFRVGFGCEELSRTDFFQLVDAWAARRRFRAWNCQTDRTVA